MIKHITGKTAAIAMLFISSYSNANAQSPNTTAETKSYLEKLAGSKDSADRKSLHSKLISLAAGKNEREMMMAANFYFRIGMAKKSDSISLAQLKKFPTGIYARNKAQSVIYNAKSAHAMEMAYRKFLNQFPPKKFATGQEDDEIVYDYARSAIANKYAEERNTAKAIEYASLFAVDFWKGNGYAGLTKAFYDTGDLNNAEIYAKKAMENAEYYASGKKGDSNNSKFAASGYAGLSSTYSNILFERKKYDEALKRSELAYKSTKTLDPQINYRYALILMALDRNQDAYEKLDEVIQAGKVSPEMLDTFKTLYIKTKGTEDGFDQYAALSRKNYLEKLNEKLLKTSVNEEAADFVLTDLKGQQVSLSALKGKVVVLDFWATWCAPCKASFPAMQMAEDKYAKDDNVKFLFIHTWEKSANAAQDAAAYIRSKNYNFQVLMDLKDPETKTNKVITSYKVSGIPAKFIIDAKGNIRFRVTGFEGSNQAAVDELSAMIEIARKEG